MACVVKVTNKTMQAVEVLGTTIEPCETKDLPGTMSEKFNINSGIGSCEVLIKAGKRTFKEEGQLRVREGSVDYENGERMLFIYQTVAS